MEGMAETALRFQIALLEAVELTGAVATRIIPQKLILEQEAGEYHFIGGVRELGASPVNPVMLGDTKRGIE